jgi:maleylpyruvate isomerase
MSEPAHTATRSDSDAEVPTPRTEQVGVDPAASARHANDGLTAVRRAGARLAEIVHAMNDTTAHEPSALPGWTRGHVVSHLARNADALVNLLTWAKTGVEHPMYPSRADRNADIEQGAQRLFQVLWEDLDAATSRFYTAAGTMQDTAWSAALVNVNGQGRSTTAAHVPWLRLCEVLIHLVDLDCGISFDEAAALAGDQTATMFDHLVETYAGRENTPHVHLRVTLPDGDVRTWTIGSPDAGETHEVAGNAGPALAWLSGRDRTPALDGAVPTLPDWL